MACRVYLILEPAQLIKVGYSNGVFVELKQYRVPELQVCHEACWEGAIGVYLPTDRAAPLIRLSDNAPPKLAHH